MKINLIDKLVGCIYTVFTPFTSDGSIDYCSLSNYLSFLYNNGARVFYVMAYNSRYSQLSDDEIIELNEFVTKKVKKFNRENVVILADPIHCSTKTSLKFAHHAKDVGADIISLICREKYFNDDQILEHFDFIGRESQFPILIHEMPFLSGYNGLQMHWPNSLFNKIPKISNVIAIKEDAKDLETTIKVLELEPSIRVIIAGSKKSLLSFKNHGCKAYLNGISMIAPKIGIKFWDAFNSDDEETLSFLINEIETPFWDKCVKKYGWHRVNKAFLECAGLMQRHERMPMPSLNDEEFSDLVNIYNDLKIKIIEKNLL